MQRSAPASPVRLRFCDSLRASGFDVSDFEIEEDASPGLSRMLGTTDRLVTVRRRSTGDERLYAAGPGRPWFALALMDVEQGCFGPLKA